MDGLIDQNLKIKSSDEAKMRVQTHELIGSAGCQTYRTIVLIYPTATTAAAATTTAILPRSPDDNLRTCVENPSQYE